MTDKHKVTLEGGRGGYFFKFFFILFALTARVKMLQG